jgi:LDH2 family malate/lactate/ureidoglycolate dehydrogenase
MIDVLTACLSGGSISPAISVDLGSREPEGIGYCFIAIPVGRLREVGDYERDLRRLADAVRGSPRAEGVPAFLIPGEREERVAEERAAAIPLDETTVELLERLAEGLGRPLPDGV